MDGREETKGGLPASSASDSAVYNNLVAPQSTADYLQFAAAPAAAAPASRTFDWNDIASESMQTFTDEEPVYRSLDIMSSVGSAPSLGLPYDHHAAAAMMMPPTLNKTQGGKGASTTATATASSPSFAHIQVPRLPSAPFRLESSHFFVTSSPAQVAELVDAQLREMGVQSEHRLHKAKWKSLVRTDAYDEVSFRVKFFFMPDQRLAVEFQRRRGDGATFQRIFRAILEACGIPSATPTPVFVTPPLPEVTDAQVDREVEPLVRMAESAQMDTVYEGLRGVALLSKVEVHQEALERVGVMPVLTRHLRSDDLAVQRVAVAAAANMANNHAAQTSLIDHAAIEPMAEMLQGSSDVDVQRHSAHALKLLAESHGQRIAEFGDRMRLHEVRDAASDPVLRSHLNDLMQLTQQACR